MLKHVCWEIRGVSYGKEISRVGSDIIVVPETNEPNYFDKYFLDESDYCNDMKNFVDQKNEFSIIEDFCVTHANSHLKESKEFSINITTPFFSGLNRMTLIQNSFKEQFPLLDLMSFDILNIDFMNGKPGYVIDISTTMNVQAIYKNIETKGIIPSGFRQSDFECKDEFMKIKIEDFKDINGTTALLEGDACFGGNYPRIFDLFNKNEKHLVGIADLYRQPDGLKHIIGIDNLIIETTGFNTKGLEKLIDAFKMINYVPKRVFFLSKVINLEDPVFSDVEMYNTSTYDFKSRLLEN
jgi:hypothetical protein